MRVLELQYCPGNYLANSFTHQSPYIFLFCSGGYNGNTSQHASHLASATTAELERLDWRLALGEVSMNLRREVADKASREELYSAVRTEMSTLEQQLAVS